MDSFITHRSDVEAHTHTLIALYIITVSSTTHQRFLGRDRATAIVDMEV